MDEREKAELEKRREEAAKLFNWEKFESVYLPNEYNLASVMRIALFHFEAGSKLYDVWSARMIKDLGPGIKPSLKEVWHKSRVEYLRLKVALEARMKEIAEEAKLEAQNREHPEKSKMGVRPTQALLFDGPIQKNIQPQKPAPQHTEPLKSEPKTDPAAVLQETNAQNEPHAPSERTKKFVEKYKRDRKAGKVKPLIPPSQREKVKISDDFSDAIYIPEKMPEDFGTSNKIINSEEFKEAAIRLLKKHGKVSFVPDEQDWKDMLYIGLYYFEGGICELQAWTEPIIKVLGNGVKPHLDELWKRTQKEFRRQFVLPDPEDMIIKEDTDAEDRLPSYIEEPHKFELKEYFKHRSITTLLIGCVLFFVFLLYCFKGVYDVHYGAPVIGHFFEKPEYDAKYYVEIRSESSGRKYKAIADIHVEGEDVTEDVGDGYWGQSRSHTFEYRLVWVKKVHLPNGSSITIEEQDWSLSLDESTFVKDSHGNKWYVTLLDEPVQK
jgi:hypothetical protein